MILFAEYNCLFKACWRTSGMKVLLSALASVSQEDGAGEEAKVEEKAKVSGGTHITDLLPADRSHNQIWSNISPSMQRMKVMAT